MRQAWAGGGFDTPQQQIMVVPPVDYEPPAPTLLGLEAEVWAVGIIVPIILALIGARLAQRK